MRALLAVALAGALALCACQLPVKKEESPLASSIRHVRTAPPILRDFTHSIGFVGFVEPKRLLSVHFLIPGLVDRCSVSEGQKVKQGQELCRMNMSAVKLEVARASNALSAAKKVLETNLPEKQKQLFDAGVIGQSEFEQVRIQSETAKAQMADSQTLYELALKKEAEHSLRAPWDGTLTKLFAKPGQPISPELPAAILSDESGYQIHAELHASLFAQIQVGTQGRLVTLSSRRLGEAYPLMVVEKGSSIVPQTQTFPVTMRLTGEAKERHPLANGVLVTGDLDLEKIPEALLIPESALNTWNQDGKASVYTLTRQSTLRLTDIRVGALADGWVQVLEGLSVEDRVVTEIAPDFVNEMKVTSTSN